MKPIMDFLWNTYDKVLELLNDVNEWYKEYITDFAWKYNLSTYTMTWLGFIKGVLLGLLLQWLF